MLELNKIHQGDCIELMKQMPDNSVDAIVTDPPYGLEFMGKEWDKFKPRMREKRASELNNPIKAKFLRHNVEYVYNASGLYDFVLSWAVQAFRVLKHGGHLLSFGGTRTYHRMACAIEDAGFEIRDCIIWCYGSGFPKSLNIGNTIAKREGAKREGAKREGAGTLGNTFPSLKECYNEYTKTENSKKWEGWGTALKPAWESIVMARKPLSEKNVAENVLHWGTGGINIDGCRVEINNNDDLSRCNNVDNGMFGVGNNDNNNAQQRKEKGLPAQGRFPANLIHDGSPEVVRMFPECSGEIGRANRTPSEKKTAIWSNAKAIVTDYGFKDSGSASRFFYCAKASREDRDFGLVGTKNTHPTVKPLMLMRYLCRLVTPPNGIVLDPFAGTGSTCIAARQEGFRFIGMEKEQQYCEIANRIVEVLKQKNLREVEA